MDLDTAASFSALPIVDARAPAVPRDGYLVRTPQECERHFCKDGRCQDHYARLASAPRQGVAECPFGFLSYAMDIAGSRFALTGVIPHPRSGTPAQREAAKRNPASRVEAASVKRAADAIIGVHKRLVALEAMAVGNYSKALHEIRKYNRTVKQTAERLKFEAEQNPRARSLGEVWKELLQIYVSSELMSRQFDVIEVLANESVTALPPQQRAGLVGFVWKLISVMQEQAEGHKIEMRQVPGGYNPTIQVSDMTFPIIVTSLLGNAIKYSVPNTPIYVTIEQDRDKRHCWLRISNDAPTTSRVDPVMFERGTRGTTDSEGSGNGLYVASLVAQQHGTQIEVNSQTYGEHLRHTFSVRFRTL